MSTVENVQFYRTVRYKLEIAESNFTVRYETSSASKLSLSIYFLQTLPRPNAHATIFYAALAEESFCFKLHPDRLRGFRRFRIIEDDRLLLLLLLLLHPAV